MRAVGVAFALTLALSTTGAQAAPVDYGGAYVIFSRGDALYRVEPTGKGETQIATLPAGASVRALRTDEAGKVLLANLGGKWAWMPLDGTANTLRDLPCGDGPAQIANDGVCVICRSATSPDTSTYIVLATNKAYPLPIPPVGARIVGSGPTRKLVWANSEGVWSALARAYSKKTKVAPEAPLRGFLPSPDGSSAMGVYSDFIHQGKTKVPAEITMTFALDGIGARRKTIKAGVGAEWSHDSKWMLMQDRGSACIVQAVGGEYKCWRGYTAASIASDGKYALLLGSRERAAAPTKSKGKKDKKSKKDKKAKEREPEPEPAGEAENAEGHDDEADDVEVPPPSGPLALYRAAVSGAYTTSPARIVQVIDGSAVWVPGPPAPEAAP